MSQKYLSRFTPSMMPPEDLEAIFVQREKLARRTVELIRDSAFTAAKHHTLLVGSRGIGKTHFVSLVYNRLKKQEDLQPFLRIAWLQEEEWGVEKLLDLLVRILQALIKEYNDKSLAAQLEQLYDLSQAEAEKRAGKLLKEWAGKYTLLLIIENLDDLFYGLKESGQQKLRSYLQENPFCTILATAQSLFNGVSLQTFPFYGFFRLEHLQSLELTDVQELLCKIALQDGNKDLANFLTTSLALERIKAIHHLAGGCHRIYIIFYQFLTRESLDTLVDSFIKTLDELTPYYQSRMASLSVQQRKIVEFLCKKASTATVKEIARSCFISHQTASSQLKELLEKGYFQSTSSGRESIYEIREPLMRLCVEIKQSRGKPIRLFIEFLKHWYSPTELETFSKTMPTHFLMEQQYLKLALSSLEQPPVPALEDNLRNQWILSMNILDKSIQKERKEQLVLELEKSLPKQELADSSQNHTLADILNRLGNFYYSNGKYKESELAYTRSLQIMEKVSGSDSLDTSVGLFCVASIYSVQKKYEEAEPLHRRALNLREKILGLEHPDVANSLHSLASVYANQRKYDKAELLYKYALTIQEKVLDPENPDIANVLDNLASLYRIQRKYDLAEPLHMRALTIRRKALDQESPDIAISLNNLAHLYYEQGKYEQAESLFKCALEIRKKVLDSESLDLARSQSGLACAYAAQGKYEQAEFLYREALQIQQKLLGPGDPDIADSLNNLASTYSFQRKYEQAEPLYQEALRIQQKIGQELPGIATILNNLAELYSSIGKYGQAELLYKEALQIDKRIWGDFHPSVAVILHNLGNLYRGTNRYSEAEFFYLRALEIREATLNREHPDLIDNYSDLAFLYNLQTRWSEAITYFERSLQSTSRLGGEFRKASLILEIGYAHSAFKEWGKSLRYYQEVLNKFSLYSTSENDEVERWVSLLANCFLKSLRVLAEMGASVEKMKEWFTLWQPAFDYLKELQITARLLDHLIQYREKNGDQRVLLALPIEERRILEELIAMRSGMNGPFPST